MSDYNFTNSIKILSIDAKDIYIANHYTDSHDEKIPDGYNIRYLQGDNQGKINMRRFINTLDSSLDLSEMRSVYKKVYRNSGFSFTENGQEYTTRVINVTFKYSNKEFNKIRKDTYVKSGCNPNQIVFQDHVCFRGNELIAIEVNKPVEHPVPELLPENSFYFEDGAYRAKSGIPTLHTIQELRNILYAEGFYCDGIKYVRYKRSGGSARVGKCLFIDERLYKRMMSWAMCGLKVREGQPVDLAGLEAYLALPLSSIIGTIELRPENFLIIDDYTSSFQENVVATRLEENSLKTDEQTVTIHNSIWDGQSLLDVSLFKNYPSRGMLLLRNKFFKSACFNCNIQKWFSDNNITDISQLHGFTIAKDISEIKIITTPSSIKYLKFGTIQNWFKYISHAFGIVKHEKPTHFFDGRMVQTHYQLLNTLQMSENEVRSFLQPSLNYLRMLKTDPSVLRYHIKYPIGKEWDATPTISKNDIVYRLLGLNERFAETKLYHNFKCDLTKAYVKNLRCGHILVNGNYSTLLGNPIEMLTQAIGTFDGLSQIGTGSIHSKRFSYNKTLLGSRSPHVTIGNVWLAKNTANQEIDTYLNLSNEIVCVNSIGESTLDRLSGCDFDSDTVLLTDNQLLINAAKKNYNLFKVPVNQVSAVRRKRNYTNTEKADLDIKTSDNKIGDIINLSQTLNSLLWDRMNKGAAYIDIKELYYDICQLDVMSGIEIDKAKKEYTTDTYNEMKLIKEKWVLRDDDGRMIKPNFFGYLARAKGYYDSSGKNYLRHDTTMDYLQKIINQFQAGFRGTNKGTVFLPFSQLLQSEGCNLNHSVKHKQANKVIDVFNTYTNRKKAIYMDDTLDNDTRYQIADELRKECIDYIGNIRFSKSTMLYLLRYLEQEEQQHLEYNILTILFGYPNSSFYSIIKESKEPQHILTENTEGNILLFDFRFQKVLYS